MKLVRKLIAILLVLSLTGCHLLKKEPTGNLIVEVTEPAIVESSDNFTLDDIVWDEDVAETTQVLNDLIERDSNIVVSSTFDYDAVIDRMVTSVQTRATTETREPETTEETKYEFDPSNYLGKKLSYDAFAELDTKGWKDTYLSECLVKAGAKEDEDVIWSTFKNVVDIFGEYTVRDYTYEILDRPTRWNNKEIVFRCWEPNVVEETTEIVTTTRQPETTKELKGEEQSRVYLKETSKDSQVYYLQDNDKLKVEEDKETIDLRDQDKVTYKDKNPKLFDFKYETFTESEEVTTEVQSSVYNVSNSGGNSSNQRDEGTTAARQVSLYQNNRQVVFKPLAGWTLNTIKGNQITYKNQSDSTTIDCFLTTIDGAPEYIAIAANRVTAFGKGIGESSTPNVSNSYAKKVTRYAYKITDSGNLIDVAYVLEITDTLAVVIANMGPSNKVNQEMSTITAGIEVQLK